MTDFQIFRCGSRDRKAYVTLSRMDVMDAIDDRMPRELCAAVEQVDADPRAHVIILAGEV